MRKYDQLKRIVLLSGVLLLLISPPAGAHTKDYDGNGIFKEVWIKLWEKGGRMVDLRIKIGNRGSLWNVNAGTVDLANYPFQLDVSALGDVADEDIQGIVSGYQITPDRKPIHPLMVRWWIVKQSPSVPNSPHALTLMLRTWDSDGIEFDLQRQQAMLVDQGYVIGESSGIRPVN